MNRGFGVLGFDNFEEELEFSGDDFSEDFSADASDGDSGGAEEDDEDFGEASQDDIDKLLEEMGG